MEMKDCIKTLSLFCLVILFISCNYGKTDIVKQTNYNLNLIKEKRYDELSNSLYQFNYKDTFFLNNINKHLCEDSLLFSIDTLEDAYMLNISILNIKKYDSLSCINILEFYYNKSNTKNCKLYVSNILPILEADAKKRDSELDEFLKNFK
jgi:hypothetical protein